jgi:hypothetical protein
MFTLFKNSLVFLATLSLSACLDITENSDEKLVGAITEPVNNSQTDQSAQTVSLIGVISNMNTGASIADATAHIKIGDNLSDSVAITSGEFQLHNLPADVDYELVVHSTANEFADRSFFGKTRSTNSMNEVYQDLGVLTIAAN